MYSLENYKRDTKSDITENSDMTDSITTEIIPDLVNLITTQSEIIDELMTVIIPSIEGRL